MNFQEAFTYYENNLSIRSDVTGIEYNKKNEKREDGESVDDVTSWFMPSEVRGTWSCEITLIEVNQAIERMTNEEYINEITKVLNTFHIHELQVIEKDEEIQINGTQGSSLVIDPEFFLELLGQLEVDVDSDVIWETVEDSQVYEYNCYFSHKEQEYEIATVVKTVRDNEHEIARNKLIKIGIDMSQFNAGDANRF